MALSLEKIYVLILGAALSASGSYVPGTPGASWTPQELAETKQKLTWIMDHPEEALRSTNGGNAIADDYTFEYGDLDSILPTAAKLVRLGFHDCLPEKTTGAGCNGCLNFEGVGNRYYLNYCAKPHGRQNKECKDKEGGKRPKKQLETDNNNLLWVGNVLEDVYKNANYAGIQSSESLFEAGKSRADFWAFASLVAVRHTLKNNDKMCQNYQPTAGCSLAKNDTSFCSFNLNAPEILPKFQTGRSDCVGNCKSDMPDFCTTKHEIHPNPHGTGVETGTFFNESFNLNVQVRTSPLASKGFAPRGN